VQANKPGQIRVPDRPKILLQADGSEHDNRCHVMMR
jgi:hypothetical protein